MLRQNNVWRDTSLLMTVVFSATMSACSGGGGAGLSRALNNSATIEYLPRNGEAHTKNELSCLEKINEQRKAEDKIPVTAVTQAHRPPTKGEKAMARAAGRGAAFVVGVFAMPLLPLAGMQRAKQESDYEDFKWQMEQCLNGRVIVKD